MTHTCRTCALADWQRTAAGKLHPSGLGHCRWVTPEFAVPIWVRFAGTQNRGEPPVQWGFSIERNNTKKCPAWEAKPDA